MLVLPRSSRLKLGAPFDGYLRQIPSSPGLRKRIEPRLPVEPPISKQYLLSIFGRLATIPLIESSPVPSLLTTTSAKLCRKPMRYVLSRPSRILFACSTDLPFRILSSTSDLSSKIPTRSVYSVVAACPVGSGLLIAPNLPFGSAVTFAPLWKSPSEVSNHGSMRMIFDFLSISRSML